MKARCFVVLALASVACLASPARCADLLDSLKKGTPTLKSAGPLAFGPEGILFVGDPQAATIFAVDTGDRTAPEKTGRPKVEGVNEKLASLLGIETKQLLVNDLAVNPISGNTYFSLSRGRGPKAMPVLARMDRAGKFTEFGLKDVKFAKATLPNAVEGKMRQEAITHLAYVGGKVIIAGLSNEEFASKLRTIPFPFTAADKGTSVEIFHGAHGRLETRSPVRVFAPYKIGGEDHVLAAYTCTPLVKFPVKDLEPGKKIKGTTVAELGNRNRPLSMIIYQKGGKDYVLMANSSRGMMKIPLAGVDKIEAITEPVKGTAGLKYDTIASLKGVVLLDRFDKDHALVAVRTDEGSLNLETIELP
jgi:hypothetical protein